MPLFSRKKHHLSPPQSPPADGLTSQSTHQPGPVCTWSALAPQSRSSPFPRSDHTLTATATASHEFFLFGGWVHDCACSDLYVFSTRDISTTLLQTSGEVPTPRRAHGTALIGTTLLICGGKPDFGSQNVPNHDSLYLLNLGTSDLLMSSPTPADHSFCALESREWTRVVAHNPGPNSRIYHTTTVIDSKLFVFGGRIGGDVFNDMWTLNLNSRTFAYSTAAPNHFDTISLQ